MLQQLEKEKIDNKEEKSVIKLEKNWKKYIIHCILIVILLILLSFSMKNFNNADEIYSFNNIKYVSVTICFWLSEYLILKGITNRTKLSLGIVIVIQTLFDIMNGIVRTVRGSAITIADIFAIKTALSVSNNIKFTFNKKFYTGLIFVAIIILILVIFRKKYITKEGNTKTRVAKILIGISILLIFSQTNIYKKYSLWDINEAYRTMGSQLTVCRMLYNTKVVKSKDYDKEELKNILEGYEKNNEIQTASANINEDDKPNIIVIVNESFCDYYNLYKDGYANPIEYFTELSKSENVISGTMYSSTFGGQTSNVEYEFLTQNSIRILPIGSYVFQQYITNPIKSSLVQNLKIQGYKTSAIHPWENFAYSRNKVYNFLGFDNIKFKNDIEGLENNFNNDFYTDKSTYKEMLRQINEKEKDEKVFEYVLTVQNHTGYNTPDPNQITYNDDNSKNVYMQLIHESSEALKQVIDELKQKDEKYILLFFGDHQPNLDGQSNFEERAVDHYEVPFIIWANYDIKEQYNIKTSTIFLQNYLLKAAGLKYSAMNSYMEELQKYYPVITKRFYMDTKGNIFQNEEDTAEIKEYEKMDYYRIFDDK